MGIGPNLAIHGMSRLKYPSSQRWQVVGISTKRSIQDSPKNVSPTPTPAPRCCDTFLKLKLLPTCRWILFKLGLELQTFLLA